MAHQSSLAEEFGIKLEENLSSEDPLMLIADQQDLRLIMAHHLAKLGFRTVKQFTNGYEAMQYLKDMPASKFSVTIADKEMPVLGGYGFLAELKYSASVARGSFAICIDQPTKEEIMLATESGVDGILVKPFTFKDIVPKLRLAHKAFYNPNNPELVYELAKAELRAGNFERAEQIFKRLSQSAKGAARPLVGLARIASERKEYQKAFSFLQEAELRNNFFVSIFVERARIYGLQNRIEDAVKQFQQAIAISPLNPLRYEEATELLFKLDKFQEAADLLTIAVDNKLAFPSLHNSLSRAFFALKDYKKATKYIKSALLVEPENIMFLNQLGICYKESELFEEAAKTYNTVIKMDPHNKSALYNKGVMLSAKGQHEEAVKLLKRCLEMHPDFEGAKRKLVEIEGKARANKVAS